MVTEQARRQAAKFIAPAQHTMLLEDKAPGRTDIEALPNDSVVDWVDRPGLWSA
jgi:hypothetical protein